MARQAGDYESSLTWLVRSVTKNTSTGQDVETFTDNGILWGSVSSDTAIEANAFGALQSQSTGSIRLRQYPDVKATDRLIYRNFETTYMITGVRWGNNETIAEVILYDGQTVLGDA